MGREHHQVVLKRERHRLNLLRYIEPATLAKIIGGLGIWAASMLTVRHEAAVDTAEAVDQTEAVAALAVFANEQVDSLRVEVKKLKREVRLLKLATPEGRLSAARMAAASGKPWKPRTNRQPSLFSRLKFW